MKIENFTLELKDDTVPWRLVRPGSLRSKEWCVLWLQGWTSSMDSHLEGIKRMAKAANVPFATMDYAGHGLHAQDIETSTRKQQHNEVVAVFDELKKAGYEKIIVIGGSFGGYMASLLVGVRPAHTVILRCPANYPDSELETPYNQTLRHKNYYEHAKVKAYIGTDSTNKALISIRKFGGFVYVMEHELDEVVPKNLPMAYFENAKHGNYLIIPGTKHSPKLMPHPEKHYEYIERLVVALICSVRLELQ